MEISVIICTYNRSSMLRDTLESFFKQELNGQVTFELLMVDNNSSDDTAQVIEFFREQYPETVKYIFEQKQGLSEARNTGIRNAVGKIIAFVDDDVYFDRKWLISTVKAFERLPNMSCLGGKTIPKFEVDRPQWIDDEFFVYYGTTNSGNQIKEMSYPKHPFGVNMAFRKNVFEKVGLFNTCLGRNGKKLLSGEEDEIFYRINREGLKVFYSPESVLYHRVTQERTKKEWILERSYWEGVSKVIFMQNIAKKNTFGLVKEMLEDINYIKNIMLGQLIRSPKKIYWHFCSVSFIQRAWVQSRFGSINQKIFEILMKLKLK